ncbi:MAG: PaaI family thioesterase [Mycobacterium sp.]
MLHPPNTPLGRFGMETLVDSPEEFVGTIPMSGLVNPVTGAPTVAPLAVLVDFVAGLVNHYRRAHDEWTVSSELSLELSPDASAVMAHDPEVPVVGSARPFGPKGSTSLGVCELTHRDTVIGIGTVRSMHISIPGQFAEQPDPPTSDGRPTGLAEIMALRVTGGALFQSPNAVLNNSMGVVHGGIAAAGLELAASAALNADGAAEPLDTASLRVNYLRPFRAGHESRYTAGVLRRGRRSGIADAKGVTSDGDVALIARVTAYRAE